MSIKTIPVSEPDQLRAINENFQHLDKKLGILSGAQGEQKMLGDINMNMHRIRNVRSKGARDAISRVEAETMVAEMSGSDSLLTAFFFHN